MTRLKEDLSSIRSQLKIVKVVQVSFQDITKGIKVDKQIVKKSKKVSKEDKKTFILDTNILLSDAECLKSFQNNDIVLPLIVVEELDRFKDKQDDIGKNAREITRQLIELVKENSQKVKTGISIGKNKGQLKILNQKDLESNVLITIPELDGSKGDNKIIQFCLEYKQKFSKEKVILVTRDLLLRIKAISVGIDCEDYKKLSKELVKTLNMPASESEFYSGVKTFSISKEEMDKFYQNKNQIILTEEEEKGLYINQFIVFESTETDAKIAGRFIAPGQPLKYVPFQANAWNIKSKNVEQAFLLDLLLDDKISFVSVNSKSGCGKNLISMAAALELTLSQRKYNKILITRNIQPLGKDIGMLPGPQPLDAKVLTPKGWVTMGSLKIGDKVISRDGKPTKIIGVYPKGKKEVFRVETVNGQITECCEDHLWYAKTQDELKFGKQGKVLSTKQIKENLMKEKDGKFIPNFFIPKNEPVKFNLSSKSNLPGYTLGVLLSDKFSINRNVKNIKITEKIKEEEKFATISNKNLSDLIPNEYLYNSSFELRIALLQGIIDIGGKTNKNGDLAYSTKSKNFKSSISELVYGLGGYIKVEPTSNITEYKFKIFVPKTVKLFNTNLQKANSIRDTDIGISSITKVGIKEVQCIRVENPEHLYVTDDFIVTHNTADEKMAPWIAPFKDNLEFLLNENIDDAVAKGATKGKKGENLKHSFMMKDLFERGIIQVEATTFIRGRSIPNCIFIVDEAQNLSMHEMKTILTRVGEGTKIIFLGDQNQIDNTYLNKFTNGLIVAIEKFKGNDIVGHITLTKGERSKFANLANDILNAE